MSHDGKPTTHPAGNATVTLRCCGSKVIRQEEECCNGIGYNPERHVCADQPTPGLPVQVRASRHKGSPNSEWCVICAWKNNPSSIPPLLIINSSTSPSRLPLQRQCLRGALCPVAAAPTAYCGACDLDPSLTACTWVLSARAHDDDKSSATDSPSVDAMREIPATGLSTRANRSANVYKMVGEDSEGVETGGDLCPSHEEVVYSGDANTHTYTGNLHL